MRGSRGRWCRHTQGGPSELTATRCLLLQYNLPFYLQYLAKWPEYCLVAEGPGRQCMGYVLGKAEGIGEGWHGHVTAVTVAPEFRCAQLRDCDVRHEIMKRQCLSPDASSPGSPVGSHSLGVRT